MNKLTIALITGIASLSFLVRAAEPTAPAPVMPRQTPTLLPVSAPPASYPKDVPIPEGAKAVAAADREIGLIIVFMTKGKSEPMRVYYEDELAKHGFTIAGADRIGPEQGVFATKGERTLTIFLEERGDDLQIQVAHVPKPPAKP